MGSINFITCKLLPLVLQENTHIRHRQNRIFPFSSSLITVYIFQLCFSAINLIYRIKNVKASKWNSNHSLLRMLTNGSTLERPKSQNPTVEVRILQRWKVHQRKRRLTVLHYDMLYWLLQRRRVRHVYFTMSSMWNITGRGLSSIVMLLRKCYEFMKMAKGKNYKFQQKRFWLLRKGKYKSAQLHAQIILTSIPRVLVYESPYTWHIDKYVSKWITPTLTIKVILL